MRRPLTAVAAGLAAVAIMAGCSSAGAKSLPVGVGAVPHLGAGQHATVTYCNGEQAHITEPPQLHGPAPTAVYVHGGSWVSGDFDTGGFIINKIGPALVQFGFVVVSVDYRLGPNKPWPAQIEDVKCAIRYLRANAKALHVNPNEIGAWGHSAGGHLVSLLGTAGPDVGWDVGAFANQSSRVQAVIDLAGPSDLPTMGSFGAAGVVQDSFISLLGTVPPNKLGAALTQASPVTYVSPGDPPFLIFHSNNDPVVSYKQSQDLAWDLTSAGDSALLVTVNGGGHLFTQKGASPTPAQITDLVLQFFVKELHARPELGAGPATLASPLTVCQIRSAMELHFDDQQEAFRREARAWLAAHVPSEPLPSLDTPQGFEAHRIWERTLFDDRWSVVSWPTEYGGRDVGIMEWLVFEEEYYRARAPKRVSQNGIFLLAPTMLEYGTEAQKARYLPPMAAGDEIWCQGWSEPDAGSDLAGIRSKATRTAAGDGWRLTGQKTWASRGAFAEWCFGIFRTDPEAERHRGLTYFLIPMDAPGITVRPIPQIDGETGFAEIFFDNVEVPDDQVLGQVGAGWSVAMATAGSERGLSLRSPARYTEAAGRLLSLFDQRGGPPSAADDIARAYMDAEAYKLHTYWTATKVRHGHAVGPEASCNKVFWSETDVAIHQAALSLLGPDAELLESGGPGEWLDGYLFSLAGPIYAGTNEIQRNVVAERLLGLPRG